MAGLTGCFSYKHRLAANGSTNVTFEGVGGAKPYTCLVIAISIAPNNGHQAFVVSGYGEGSTRNHISIIGSENKYLSVSTSDALTGFNITNNSSDVFEIHAILLGNIIEPLFI